MFIVHTNMCMYTPCDSVNFNKYMLCFYYRGCSKMAFGEEIFLGR